MAAALDQGPGADRSQIGEQAGPVTVAVVLWRPGGGGGGGARACASVSHARAILSRRCSPIPSPSFWSLAL